MQSAGAIDTNPTEYTIEKKRTTDDFIEIDEYDGVPIYASISSYIIGNLRHPLIRHLMIIEAMVGLNRAGMHDASKDRVRVLRSRRRTDDYEFMWVVRDERGITFMFPEDY
jgi:hypothetical protein